MKYGMCAVVLGLCVPVTTAAGEWGSAARHVSTSVPGGGYFTEEPQGAAVRESVHPIGVTATWGSLRHGNLWADYCLPRSPYVAMPIAPHPTASRPAWLLLPFAGTGRAQPCMSPCSQQCVPWSRLRELLGWPSRCGRRDVCLHRVSARDQLSPCYVDDLPPRPVSDPIPTPAQQDVLSAEPEAQVVPVPVPAFDEPVLIAPHRDELEQDAPPTTTDPPPSTTDDPAPEPQSEIPRNQLPAPRPTRSESSRVPSAPTTLTGRLSDFIRVR